MRVRTPADIKRLIDADLRNGGSRNDVQGALKMIRPLSSYSEDEDVPIEKLERLILVLSKKYAVRIRELVPDVWSNSGQTIWRAEVIDENDLSQVSAVYALSLYDVLAKVSLLMYSVKDRVGLRNA